MVTRILIISILGAVVSIAMATNTIEQSVTAQRGLYYPEEKLLESGKKSPLEKIKKSLKSLYNQHDYSTAHSANMKRSQFIHNQGGSDYSGNISNALGVAGLGLLFINQLAAALHIPFLIPLLLLPLSFLIVATLLGHGGMMGALGGGGGGGGVAR